jgi:hypothetical protein
LCWRLQLEAVSRSVVPTAEVSAAAALPDTAATSAGLCVCVCRAWWRLFSLLVATLRPAMLVTYSAVRCFSLQSMSVQPNWCSNCFCCSFMNNYGCCLLCCGVHSRYRRNYEKKRKKETLWNWRAVRCRTKCRRPR